MGLQEGKKTNTKAPSDLLRKHSDSPCIYMCTHKQIKVTFYLDPSEWDMIFPFNDSSCISLTQMPWHSHSELTSTVTQ